VDTPQLSRRVLRTGKAVPLRSIEAHLGDRRYSSYSFLTSALEGGELRTDEAVFTRSGVNNTTCMCGQGDVPGANPYSSSDILGNVCDGAAGDGVIRQTACKTGKSRCRTLRHSCGHSSTFSGERDATRGFNTGLLGN
jgi:hypothetical protein